MAKLLTVSTLIIMPPGATGGTFRVLYPFAYRVGAALAGGTFGGKIGPPNAAGQSALLTLAGDPIKIFGGELGDPAPPLVTIRISPTGGPGSQLIPYEISGHPREITAGQGAWDLSAIGGGSGPILATEAQRAALDASTAAANIAAGTANTAAGSANSAAGSAITAGAQALTQAGAVRFTDDAERTANPRPPGTWSYTVTTNMLHRFEGSAWVPKGPGVASLPAVQAVAALSASIDAGLQIAAKAALTDTPRRGGETRRIADGSVWEYSATGVLDATGAVFGTVQPHIEGGYWKRQYQTRSVEFYGAVDCPDGSPKVNSSIAFGLAMAALPYGAILTGSGTYYLGNTWEINRDDVTIRINGVLRPMPGMVNHLVKASDVADNQKRWGGYTTGNPWQAKLRIAELNIDGVHQSRGIWIRGRDHYNIAGLMVRNCYGNALRMDAVREGQIVDAKILTSRQGPDKGCVEYLDTTVGSDANNTNRAFGLNIIHCIGCHLYIDTPYVAKGPNGEAGTNSQSRLLEITGIQIETVGPSQVALGFGTLSPLPTIDTTVDIVQIRTGDSIEFIGGHIFVDTLTLPASGGVTRGGAMIRLGFDTDAANNRPNKVTNFRALGLKSFVGQGDAGAVHLARHNCDSTEFDMIIIGATSASPEWVNGASGGQIRTHNSPYRVQGGGLATSFSAIGPAAASGTYQMQAGTAKGRMFAFPGQVVLQPNEDNGTYVFFGSDGGMWAQGTDARNAFLGNTGQGYKGVIYTPQTAAPSVPAGTMVVANGVSWNPLGRATNRPYPVFYDGTNWI